MKIGNIEFGPRPLFLAPMEDVTDIGFRHLCKRFGASMVYTEFVSAEALVRSVNATLRKLHISDEERPVGIQIYGRDVESMVEAARIVEEVHPDVIDINFGCPVKKVAGKGAISRNAAEHTASARHNTQCGEGCQHARHRENASGMELRQSGHHRSGRGSAGLRHPGATIHGRTRAQMYTGEADWTLIGEVKRNPRIHIPIIGNGDICTPEQARDAFDRYGVDAVMVGRATFGRPWIFKEMRDLLDGRPEDTSLTFDRKLDILLEQLRINVERIDEYRGILHTRRHIAASPIFKGIPDFRQTRIAMLRATTVEELTGIMEEVREKLNAH